MDQETLDWISHHRPTFTSVPPLRPSSRLLIPDATWFADIRLTDSLHGIRHNARVSLLASALAQESGLDQEHTVALCVAAAVHDCRRHDDRSDPGHGRRAGDWFTDNAALVLEALGCGLTPLLIGRAALAIGLHDVPYEGFTGRQTSAYRQAPHLVDLLKAADAMDRYRLPLVRWWPDASRLRVGVPDWLHPFAAELMVRSEQARLDGATHRQALRHACRFLIHEQ